MSHLTLRKLISWLLSAIVAITAFKYGYDFGLEVSGLLLGIIAGANCAIFGVVMADSVFARLMSPKAADPVQK